MDRALLTLLALSSSFLPLFFSRRKGIKAILGALYFVLYGIALYCWLLIVWVALTGDSL